MGGDGIEELNPDNAHLHHGPLPAPRVQNVDVVEPLPVLGPPEHKDALGVGVVDRGVADPALGGGTLRQSLRRQPGQVLCGAETKAVRRRACFCEDVPRVGGPTCAQLPDGVFAELHPGSLTSDQDGGLSVDGTQSLTPASGRAQQWSCRGFKEL